MKWYIGFWTLVLFFVTTVWLIPQKTLEDYPTYTSDEITCVVENQTSCVKKFIFIWTPQNVEKN